MKIKEAVIVEGRYDKIKLSSIIDALIITTDGFQIFKDKKKMALIRRLADETGIIVLTDSDSAGFLIRAKLASCIAPEKIKHAYIPDVLGKEKRKKEVSKEGKLGVEGIESTKLLAALKSAGAEGFAEKKDKGIITSFDFYKAGLSGSENSSLKRLELLKYLGLPEKMPARSLLRLLSRIMDKEEFIDVIDRVERLGLLSEANKGRT